LADAIYEGRHGQLEVDDDDDSEMSEYDEEYDDSEYSDSVIPDDDEE
jgi:small subunit ribosomal protein S2